MENKVSEPRVCSKCNEHKDGDKFYNYLSFYCISCANEFARDRRSKITSGEVYIIKKVKGAKWYRFLDSKGVRYCNGCENVKPKEEFTEDKKSLTGKKSQCKRCMSKKRYEDKINEQTEARNKFLKSEWFKKYKKSDNFKKISEKSREANRKFTSKLKMDRKKTFAISKLQ